MQAIFNFSYLCSIF